MFAIDLSNNYNVYKVFFVVPRAAFIKHSEIRDLDEKVLNMHLNLNDALQASVFLCTFLRCYLQAHAI